MNRNNGYLPWRLEAWAALLVVVITLPAGALARKHPPLTTVNVLVTDAGTHKPVFQADLTLEFRDPQSRLGKTISLSAKTDLQGTYKFTFIPMETVLLVVTARNHQSFGKQYQITRPGQTIEVVLRPPQPLR